eukprot:633340-Pleurochrysis_carterae.AAC.2
MALCRLDHRPLRLPRGRADTHQGIRCSARPQVLSESWRISVCACVRVPSRLRARASACAHAFLLEFVLAPRVWTPSSPVFCRVRARAHLLLLRRALVRREAPEFSSCVCASPHTPLWVALSPYGAEVQMRCQRAQL